MTTPKQIVDQPMLSTLEMQCRITELEAALRPFAKLAREFNVYAHEDNWLVLKRGDAGITVGDLRRVEKI